VDHRRVLLAPSESIPQLLASITSNMSLCCFNISHINKFKNTRIRKPLTILASKQSTFTGSYIQGFTVGYHDITEQH